MIWDGSNLATQRHRDERGDLQICSQHHEQCWSSRAARAVLLTDRGCAVIVTERAACARAVCAHTWAAQRPRFPACRIQRHENAAPPEPERVLAQPGDPLHRASAGRLRDRLQHPGTSETRTRHGACLFCLQQRTRAKENVRCDYCTCLFQLILFTADDSSVCAFCIHARSPNCIALNVLLHTNGYQRINSM